VGKRKDIGKNLNATSIFDPDGDPYFLYRDSSSERGAMKKRSGLTPESLTTLGRRVGGWMVGLFGLADRFRKRGRWVVFYEKNHRQSENCLI